jgi:hypothetical protein
MNDNDVMREVRDSLSGLHMSRPVDAIVARGRARRRGRLSGLAGAGVAAGVALTLGLTSVMSSGNAPRPASPRTAQLAAFSVVSGPNGTSTLTLRKGKQYRLDPNALRQALAQYGIPALVTVGTMCDTAQEPNGIDRVMSTYRLADGAVVTKFNPAAIPAGSKLSIGYFPTGTSFALIEDGAALICNSNPGDGGGPGVHRSINGNSQQTPAQLGGPVHG